MPGRTRWGSVYEQTESPFSPGTEELEGRPTSDEENICYLHVAHVSFTCSWEQRRLQQERQGSGCFKEVIQLCLFLNKYIKS